MSIESLKRFGVLLSLVIAAAWVTEAAAAPPKGRAVASSRPSATRQSGNFGLGVMLGDPSGITAKLWTSRATAFDFAVSYSFDDYVAFLGDHAWHFPNALRSAGGGAEQFVPYVGIGAVLFIEDEDRDRADDEEVELGLRIPLGLEFLPRTIPLGFFFEIVPGVGFVPEVYSFFQASIGARFYF